MSDLRVTTVPLFGNLDIHGALVTVRVMPGGKSEVFASEKLTHAQVGRILRNLADGYAVLAEGEQP